MNSDGQKCDESWLRWMSHAKYRIYRLYNIGYVIARMHFELRTPGGGVTCLLSSLLLDLQHRRLAIDQLS